MRLDGSDGCRSVFFGGDGFVLLDGEVVSL